MHTLICGRGYMFKQTLPTIHLLIALLVLVLGLIACGSDDSKSQDAALMQEITAEVCTDGEGRKSKLYVRNTDDFEWVDVKIDLIKGGQNYTMTLERLLPESDIPAEPFTDSTQFFYWLGGADQKPGGKTGISLNARNSEKFVLTNFSHLQNVSIEAKLPFPAKWSGEPQPC